MRISKPSIRNAALLVALGAASAALAQDATREVPSGNARRSAADQGQKAMDRLESAVAREKEAAEHAPDPRLPRTDDPDDRRRAFEGLRGRAHMPEMEARARAAQVRGETSL